MNNDNYKFILADDHKGNKALVVIKGNLTRELVNKSKVVDDSHFYKTAQQLKKIIESSSIIEKDSDSSCN